MRRFVAALTVFAVMLLAAPGAQAIVNVEGRYWFSNFDDKVKISKGSVIGTDINLVDDLGVDDSRNFWEGRITLELGSHKLRYGFMPLEWKGSKSLNRSITFNGQTYSASTNVNTELKADYHRLGYEYDIIDSLNNKLGVIFEVKYFDAKASLDAPSAGIHESADGKAPIPTIGVAAQVGLPFLFSVGGEVTGITVGSKGYMYDAEAAVNFKPAPFVIVSGGYRILKLHAENSDDLADLEVKGPFLTLVADF